MITSAQNVPNGDFESWEINHSGVAAPSVWETHNEPEFILVESAPGHNGNNAVCLNVVWDYMLKTYCGASLTSEFVNSENQTYDSR